MEIRDLLKLTPQEQGEVYYNYLESIKKEAKENYSDTELTTFEDYMWNEYFKCNNCNEWKQLDDKGTSELALQDNICDECMNHGGYGR